MAKEYLYFPGCSVEATSVAYNDSALEVCKRFDISLKELEDWNCCGATAYMSVRELLALAISARNLALAERTGKELVTPCSACYTVLNKTNTYMKEHPEIREKVQTALKAGGMTYNGTVRVRHLMSIFTDDIGYEAIAGRIQNPLWNLRAAPYYGCQIVRPKNDYDDVEEPVKLERLIEATGASAVYFPVKTHCCGGSLMATQQDLALRMSKNILLAAAQNEADCIVTTCPLCQINLDAYQRKINAVYGQKFDFPILYFPQLIGLALGISPDSLGLRRGIVAPDKILEKSARSVS